MKAVLFDVYETLLTGERLADRETLLRQVAANFGLEFDPKSSLTARLDQEIHLEHCRSPFSDPEVDIRVIWKSIFPSLDDPDAFALSAEEAIHPVKAITGAEDTLLELDHRGLQLGIISNAQAYTRILLQKHLPIAWPKFDPRLLFFSYEHRVAKPGHELFLLAKNQLTTIGILPNEVLMIGDSVKNDIEPAKAMGFQTCLAYDDPNNLRHYSAC